ncbi:TetR/AcrR family transcriptional regulator [Nonomuraea sp. MG754425]|uniref:TetR/AcrR family transcriptional regulator n=1 Tax=Nonomuraea sp. MG754425 TaxID=2570319 RepID=UPI001F420821|nr:TetR/AcrR family transcriptional regulator [Nonomuraea sp. MG754425]MCF6470262.1 TetR/AcrR family transcriptional regulator [Nonomuraea sp. MG754425]
MSTARTVRAGSTRAERAGDTREAILDAAERLFAERGVGEVSNRQIGLAAGQANNFAVGYHFGTKADLVRAVVRRYTTETERRRLDMLAQIQDAGPDELRAWLSCLVRPATGHLAALGVPSWRARCLAQFDTVPALRRIIVDESVATPSMGLALEGMFRLLPGLPADVRAERGDMSRLLMLHTLAERERALHERGPAEGDTAQEGRAEGDAAAGASWEATAVGLIDALTGLWQALVTTRPLSG